MRPQKHFFVGNDHPEDLVGGETGESNSLMINHL